MCSGVWLDAAGVGRVSGIYMTGRLFGLTFAVLINLAYEFGVRVGCQA